MRNKILIVDDAAFMRMMLKDIVVKAGHEVAAEAYDGNEALEKYKEFKPDLVTMDITMPNCDGLEAVSNIIASKTFELYWVSLPCAVIIFPIIYIVNDVLAECYGYQKARMAIYLGFFINLIAVICYNITMFLPAPAYFTADAAFHTVLGSTLRLLIASFIAYLVGSLINAKLMVYLKYKNEEKLFFRCIASTFAGEGMDAIIFITIGFLGTMPTLKLTFQLYQYHLLLCLF